MITCRDINNLRLDGVELLTGEAGLERMVSWTYIVQTKPYKDHMNPGNFALLVVDFLRYSIEDAYTAMLELNELGISGLAISVEEDKEAIPQQMIEKAKELKLSLFYIRWEGATFVDIAQSIGELILETEVDNKRTGDYLYNLLFGYEVNDKYIEKISAQFGLTFDRPYRVGVIVIDRKYGMNLEQDEHTYVYYTDCLNREVLHMKKKPMYMRFLNKFVLLFEAKENKETEHQIEQILRELDRDAFCWGNPQYLYFGSGLYEAGGFRNKLSGGEESDPEERHAAESDEQEGSECKLYGNLQIYVQQW